MLPHDKTPHKPRPSLAVEDPGPHAGNPSGLAATLGGRCTMAPPRANGERVSGHLPADGRFVPARRSGHPAAAIPPRLSNMISSRSAKARRAYRPMGPPDTWSSQANTIVSGTHGPTSSTSVALAMKNKELIVGKALARKRIGTSTGEKAIRWFSTSAARRSSSMVMKMFTTKTKLRFVLGL